MKNVTLCYIEKDGKYLMLHRTKKKNDINEGKWIGVGGKIEDKESPEECIVREVKEETGITLIDYRLRGVVTFVSNECETEYMYVFTSDKFTGELIECNEGDLKWIDKTEIDNLNIWEGDKLFHDEILQDKGLFTVKVEYEGDKLVNYDVREY